MRRFVSRLMVAAMILTIYPISNVSAATPQESVVQMSKSYLGVPYKYGGSTPSGFDCSGFLIYIFNKVGIQLPRTAAEQFTVGKLIEKSDLAPGDMVFFEKTMEKPGITHSGIYIGNNEFISATSSSGIKIDSLSNTYWAPKYVGAKRILNDAPPVTTSKFKDVPVSHPAFTAIHTLNDRNIIKGFNDQTFQPEQPVTRGQAAAIINRILNVEPKSLENFKDVAVSNPFARDISAMKELGVITGFTDGSYRPYEYMTRAEMAAILDRAFKITSIGSYSKASNVYLDINPNYWAYEAIVVLYHIDTTTVFQSERYGISTNATRAVFSAAIYNVMNVMN